MKTIIIPTDFSQNSIKAIDFAADYFNQAGNRFIICHVYDIPVGGTSGLFTLLEQLRLQAEKDMKELMSMLEEKYAGKHFSFESKVLQGNFEDEVKALSKSKQADFAILGTKGASGMKDILIGSNAATLLKNVDLPIFAIPTNYDKSAINEIIFSYDGNAVEQQDVQLMVDFSKENNLSIKVLHVRTEDESPIQNWNELEALFDDKHISLHELAAKNYQEGLKKGIEGSNSILVLIRRKKSFWERLVNDSDTQKAVRHFQLPILVLPDKD